MDWCVWVQSRDFNGAMSYIYPFTVFDEATAEGAIDFVLNKYCATQDGRRFLSDPITRLDRAWAAPRAQTTEVQLRPIDQPQYERVEQ